MRTVASMRTCRALATLNLSLLRRYRRVPSALSRALCTLCCPLFVCSMPLPHAVKREEEQRRVWEELQETDLKGTSGNGCPGGSGRPWMGMMCLSGRPRESGWRRSSHVQGLVMPEDERAMEFWRSREWRSLKSSSHYATVLLECGSALVLGRG